MKVDGVKEESVQEITYQNEISATSREELNEIILKELENIKSLFTYKNGNYSSDGDAMFNFRTAAQNVLGSANAENMYKVLMVYVEKHLAALRKNGLQDKEFAERCRDIIIYSLISIAMKGRAR